MIAWMAAALLAPAQDVAELVENLRDDRLEVRERAAEALSGIGDAAVPALERLARSADPDLRAAASRVLKSIAERRVMAPYWRPGASVTLEYEQAPLAEVLHALASRSGETLLHAPGDFSERVTVRVRDARFWEALDELCRLAPALSYGVEKDGIRLVRERRPPFPVRHDGEFAVWIDGLAFTKELDFTGVGRETFSVGVCAAWERGVAPAGVEIRLAELVDDRGTSLLGPSYSPARLVPTGRACRDDFRYRLAMPGEGATKLARARGTVSFSFPVCFEEVVIDLAAGKTSAKAGEGIQVSVMNVRSQKAQVALDLCVGYTIAADEPVFERFRPELVRLVDDGGAEHAVSVSARNLSLRAGSDMRRVTATSALPEGRTLARVRLSVLKEVKEHRVAFDFTDLPLK
jgi:hypothetical protein